MRWTKHGRIFEPPGDLDWIVTHATTPFALPLSGDRFRVYISGRDARNRTQIGSFEIDLMQPGSIERLTERPVIPLGPLGHFDDSGVNSSWVVEHAGRLYHYYGGWHLGTTVPFYCSIGLAISEDGGRTFEKYSPAPIVGRSRYDPCLTGTPCILIEDGVWKMWYYSGVRWELDEGSTPKHFYHIKYAESHNGMDWTRDGTVCIDFDLGEYAIARPSVIRQHGVYRMWYCYRGPAYRIGYAESLDGKTWTRLDDQVDLDRDAEAWEDQMIEYPHVFDHRGRLFMLYNGNGYGETGVGLAVLEE